MLWQLTVEAVVELIAVDSVAIEIGATFSLVIVFAAIAFWLHERLLRRAVRLAEADLRAQRAQAAETEPPVATDHRPIATFQVSTVQERWVQTRQASAAKHNTEKPPT